MPINPTVDKLSSRVMPVCYRKDRGKYKASFTYKKKVYFAGHHSTEAEAYVALQRKQDEVAAELGVASIKKVLRPYKAEIIIAGKKVYLGGFATKEQARAAYEEKKAEVEARKAERERQQELDTHGHGSGKIPLRNKDGVIVEWAIVDPEDEERVREHRWYLENTSTRVRYACSHSSKNQTIRLHTFLFGEAPNGKVMDHIDENGLNNRRQNLRFVTRPVNSHNVTQPKNSTGYIGVRNNKGRYYCRVKNLFNLPFNTALDAAKKYDEIMLKLYGPHAKTNHVLAKEEISFLLKSYNRTGPAFYKISKHGNLYKHDQRDTYFSSFEQAFDSLQKSTVAAQVEKYKSKLELVDYQKQILRDCYGNAIIELRNKNKDVIANAIVDDTIWHDAIRHNWYLGIDQYVASDMTDLGRIRLHNFVWHKLEGEIEQGKLVDHIVNCIVLQHQASQTSSEHWLINPSPTPTWSSGLALTV